MTHDERSIRNLVDTWMSASAAGDVETVLTLMADDVLFMVPGKEPFGKEQFAETSRAMKDMRLSGRSEIQELVIAGDWAYCRNRLQVTMTPPGGEAVRRSGHTLTILRRKPDGAWVIARDANLLAPG